MIKATVQKCERKQNGKKKVNVRDTKPENSCTHNGDFYQLIDVNHSSIKYSVYFLKEMKVSGVGGRRG